MLISNFLSQGVVFVSHILFPDDALVFCHGSRRAIRAVFQVIANYEKCFGKKLNKSKSGMFCHSFASMARISIVELASGINKRSFSFTYLGVPIIKSKYKTAYFNNLI